MPHTDWEKIFANYVSDNNSYDLIIKNNFKRNKGSEQMFLCAQQVVLVVKNLLAKAGDAQDTVSIPKSGRSPRRGKWQPTPVFQPEKFHGQRSLAGYSTWGHKESDKTE